MVMSGKKILVIIIMILLISSVAAGAVSFFNRSQSSSTPNNNALINARLNQVVDFCISSLPKGTSACDNQLLPVVNKICAQGSAKSTIDACSDGKVSQYYKSRNIGSNNKTIR